MIKGTVVRMDAVLHPALVSVLLLRFIVYIARFCGSSAPKRVEKRLLAAHQKVFE
jgi:hypothetical protein